MFRAQRRSLVGFGGLLIVMHLAGELNLWRYNWPEVGQLNLMACSGRGERSKEFRLSDLLQGEVGFSQGNHSYFTLTLTRQGQTVLRWWGTPSLASRPAAWIESGTTFPRVLTYQPLILSDGIDTPLGAYHSGFYLWTYDGRTYRERRIEMASSNLWLRSPFPFQD